MEGEKEIKTDATEAAAMACGEFWGGQRMEGRKERGARICLLQMLDGVMGLGFARLPALTTRRST